MSKTLQEVAKTSIQLMLKEPFYGHFFTQIIKDISDKTDSVAIVPTNNQMLKFLINEEFWNERLKGESEESTKNLRYGMIKHNILHMVFKHILRYPEFGNKKLFSVASDLCVNNYISSSQLLDDAITIEQFPDFNLEKNKGVDYYYRMLQAELEKIQQMSQDEGEDEGEGDSDDQQGQGSGGQGDEQGDQNNQSSGSGSGNGDQEKDDQNGGGSNDNNDSSEDQDNGNDNGEGQGNSDDNLNPSQKKLKDMMGDEENQHLNQHSQWDKLDKMGQAERKMLEQMINDNIKNTVKRVKSKNAGDIPAGLEQYIDLLLESLKPNVNWRRVLKIFTSSSSRTRLKNTIRRPSKRYGTTPGIKVQRKQKVMIAIDTSGSVCDDELREFFGEIYYIWKQGAEIFIVECDTDIHNTYFYNGRPPKVISGRGGTDFNAPIEYANDVYRPDAIIYFTDGYASAPEVISRKPILWLLSSNGVSEDEWDYLEGRKVKMESQV